MESNIHILLYSSGPLRQAGHSRARRRAHPGRGRQLGRGLRQDLPGCRGLLRYQVRDRKLIAKKKEQYVVLIS